MVIEWGPTMNDLRSTWIRSPPPPAPFNPNLGFQHCASARKMRRKSMLLTRSVLHKSTFPLLVWVLHNMLARSSLLLLAVDLR